MDSTELNKIAGAVIGALLVFMLLGFFSNKIYGLGPGGHHGEEQLAFAVELEASGSAGDDAPAAVDYAALAASADLAAGEKVFNKCKSCHKVEDGANGVGPHMWGVVGRDIASVGGYAYSDALSAVEGDWTLTELSAFLEDPKGYAPGTKMAFKGLKDPQDRVNLIAWLNEADGSPEPLE